LILFFHLFFPFLSAMHFQPPSPGPHSLCPKVLVIQDFVEKKSKIKLKGESFLKMNKNGYRETRENLLSFSDSSPEDEDEDEDEDEEESYMLGTV